MVFKKHQPSLPSLNRLYIHIADKTKANRFQPFIQMALCEVSSYIKRSEKNGTGET